MKVKLTKKHRESAERFADARCKDSDLYKRRGGFKREDIVIGALGELAVYKVLEENGFEDLTKPDFEIYGKAGKSFDADLKAGSKHFHVKAQSEWSRKRYGSSWLLQRTDPLLKKRQYNHYLVLTNVSLDNNEVEIHGFFPFCAVLDNGCIGECKVPSFRTTKVALYLPSFECMTKKQRWGVLG